MGGAFMEACAGRAAALRAEKKKKRKGRFYKCEECKGMYKHWKMVKLYGSIRAICKKCWRPKKKDGLRRYKCLEFTNKLLGANREK